MIDRELLPEILTFLRGRYEDLQWPDLEAVIDLFIDTETIDWWLPIAACQALNSRPAEAIPASAAVLASQAAIILVDDILDEDPKGVHQQIGAGQAANLAMALETLAFDCLGKAPISSDHRLKALIALSRMFAITSYGQGQDVGEISDETEYWTMVRNKSTPFYGLALQLGAFMAESAQEMAQGLYDLGVLVGEIVQLHDDLYDALETPARPDWRRKSNNLLILYGLTVDHAEKGEFLAKVDHAPDPPTLERLQQILIKSGAVSYCAYHLTLRHSKCHQLTQDLELPQPEPVLHLVEAQVRPIQAILDKVADPALFETKHRD